MHTIKIIAAGLLLLAAVFLLARLWTVEKPLTSIAVIAFLFIWLVISVINLWIGVYRAGYPISDELRIVVVVFSVPAAISLIAGWLSLNG